MGGSPFSSPDAQGLITGLYLQPNGSEQGSPAEQLQTLLTYSDWVRFNLAGNMRAYSMQVGGAWLAGRPGCWAARLLGGRAARLLGGQAAGRPGGWAAGRPGCWAAELGV
jgi:hypothetical protein